MEIMDADKKREKRLKTNEESLIELWENIKLTVRYHLIPNKTGIIKKTNKNIDKDVEKWKSFYNAGTNAKQCS